MTEFSAKIVPAIAEIGKDVWDGLQGSVPYHPFTDYRFLHALEDSGCAQPETGWAPAHIIVEQGGEIVAAAPLYAKSHSQGEYVFDHSWADALYRAGGEYYPKLQCSIPFTPAKGPRLLGQSEAAKDAAIAAMTQLCAQQGASSVHATFLTEGDAARFERLGFLIREDRQFHFINRGFDNFEDFLGALSSRKRKNIRKERASAQDGIEIKCLTGDDLKVEHWDAFHNFYLDTGARKWGRPYLNRAFFDAVHAAMPEKIMLAMAFDGAVPIAGALNFIGSDTLYGRHWGALGHKPFLHFELCYYQAMDFALERGLKTVEAGAQGEHKLARGYEPVITKSAHFLRHAGLHDAVASYLDREREAVESEAEFLAAYLPFRKESQ